MWKQKENNIAWAGTWTTNLANSSQIHSAVRHRRMLVDSVLKLNTILAQVVSKDPLPRARPFVARLPNIFTEKAFVLPTRIYRDSRWYYQGGCSFSPKENEPTLDSTLSHSGDIAIQRGDSSMFLILSTRSKHSLVDLKSQFKPDRSSLVVSM